MLQPIKYVYLFTQSAETTLGFGDEDVDRNAANEDGDSIMAGGGWILGASFVESFTNMDEPLGQSSFREEPLTVFDETYQPLERSRVAKSRHVRKKVTW